MISVKSSTDLLKMRKAGKITANALKTAGQHVRPGITTAELDAIINRYITENGAEPSFLGYGGFPASACISVNNEIIHGIPSKGRRLKDGDIVSIDVGAYIDGFHGDSAYTFPVGKISSEAERLLQITEKSLYIGIDCAVSGGRVGDISASIEEFCVSEGFAVVKRYCGHGVGKKLHEDPSVPNYGKRGSGSKLVNGMTIAIEPMVNVRGEDVRVLGNGWTVVTKSGSLSAHFEHTVAITPNGPLILTQPDV